MSTWMGKRSLFHISRFLDQVHGSTYLMEGALNHLFSVLLAKLWLATMSLFHGEYSIYDPDTHGVTLSWGYLLWAYSSWSIGFFSITSFSMMIINISPLEHASSFMGLLVDDFQHVVVDLTTSSLSLGAPMGAFLHSYFGQSMGTYAPTFSANSSPILEVSSSLPFSMRICNLVVSIIPMINPTMSLLPTSNVVMSSL